MLRTTLILISLAAAGPALAQEHSRIDCKRLEWFRNLPPERKAQLRQRLQLLRSLPAEERGRLRENLVAWRELSEDERKQIRTRLSQLSKQQLERNVELAQGFFQFMGHRNLKGFPRSLFFHWMEREHSGELDRIRALEESQRVAAFEPLYEEFREGAIRRLESHQERHACLDPGRMIELRQAPREDFWMRFQQVMREMRERHPPRRPHGPPPRERK